jgi:RCC1 and BTB domain-containing protein
MYGKLGEKSVIPDVDDSTYVTSWYQILQIKTVQLFYISGHGNESGHSTPRRVEAMTGMNVTDIACGSRHTAVVTNRGCLYTWGDKENGVAGHGDTEGHQYTPKLLERLSGKKVVQLSACGFHTGCLTDTMEV